ncbi:MAG: recombination protein RecR [Gammaproteobacteria bacterium]|nr:recombination protein RecR [Gammaproteobacteria bacterium]
MNSCFSPLLEHLIKTLQYLPGIGPKSAQRLAFYLLDTPKNKTIAQELSKALSDAATAIHYCKKCRNFSETDICDLCNNKSRESRLLCIVETPSDVIAIEKSGGYRGHYFVLRGRLSPLDGIGPEEIGLNLLAEQLKNASEIQEIIIATNHTVEGEATAYYISELVKPFNVKITRIARGVPLGGELEYVDSRTIAEALNHRVNVDVRIED